MIFKRIMVKYKVELSKLFVIYMFVISCQMFSNKGLQPILTRKRLFHKLSIIYRLFLKCISPYFGITQLTKLKRRFCQ